MTRPGFATIDFETTGLSAASDRAVELAVVHSEPDGTITGRWDTLIDPGRAPGPTQVHRITAAELRGAPSFPDIAPELVRLLSGRVLVAHNAGFDRRFLVAELARAGHPPVVPAVTLCTAQLSRQYLPTGRRSLARCCETFAIDLIGAHRALVDAVATAELLAAYIAHSPSREGWNEALRRAASQPLRPLPDRGVPWYPREDALRSAAHRAGRPSAARPFFAPA
jgi:DNA polymerase-3 subunit epsilon